MRPWIVSSIGIAESDPDECVILLRDPSEGRWGTAVTIPVPWPPAVKVGDFVVIQIYPMGS